MTPPQPCPLPHPPTSPQPADTWPATPRSVDLVTQRHPRAVPQTRAHLREVLRTWHLPTPLIEDAALLVTELATNAVLHGTGPTLRIHTRCHHHVLRCQLHDNGPTRPNETKDDAPPAALAPREANRTDPLPENGRGLTLVDTLATRWGTYTDPRLTNGTHVAWFEITYPETDTDLLRRVLDGLRRR